MVNGASLSVEGPPVNEGPNRCRTRWAGVVGGRHDGPQPGSRWSARSEARTNDLDEAEVRCRLGYGPVGGGLGAPSVT